LTPLLAKSGNILLGEMAHVIGRKPKGPRGSTKYGTVDTYENLILLCPACHTLVDKAPRDFPATLLRKWKADWESHVKHQLLKRASARTKNVLEMRLWSYFHFDLILNLYAKTKLDAQLRKSLTPC
jgi:hypothetical protein